MLMDKDDIEWLISLIVTIWLAVRKPKEKAPKRKRHRKQKR